MQTSIEGANRGASQTDLAPNRENSAQTLSEVLTCLEDAKAEDIVSIDLEGKSSIGDYMIIASGRSNRHVGAISDQLVKMLKDTGRGRAKAEGLPQCDWVLIDIGDIIIHIFRPEVREFYNLEKMWLADRPSELQSV